MKIYLAGPDVFEPNPKELAEKLKAVCNKFGLEGAFPLDAELALEGLTPPQQGRLIFDANVKLIRSCQGVLANMTPFRGPSMDVGTAWEMGCAYALGLPIIGYTSDDRPYLERVAEYRLRPPSFKNPDFVESFELHDNLMLDCSTVAVFSTFGEAAERMQQQLLGDLVVKSWDPQGTCTCRTCGERVKIRPSNAQDYLWYCTNPTCVHRTGEDRYTQDDQPIWADWRRHEGAQTGT